MPLAAAAAFNRRLRRDDKSFAAWLRFSALHDDGGCLAAGALLLLSQNFVLPASLTSGTTAWLEFSVLCIDESAVIQLRFSALCNNGSFVRRESYTITRSDRFFACFCALGRNISIVRNTRVSCRNNYKINATAPCVSFCGAQALVLLGKLFF